MLNTFQMKMKANGSYDKLGLCYISVYNGGRKRERERKKIKLKNKSINIWSKKFLIVYQSYVPVEIR